MHAPGPPYKFVSSLLKRTPPSPFLHEKSWLYAPDICKQMGILLPLIYCAVLVRLDSFRWSLILQTHKTNTFY